MAMGIVSTRFYTAEELAEMPPTDEPWELREGAAQGSGRVGLRPVTGDLVDLIAT
jgi:hypothetical protein